MSSVSQSYDVQVASTKLKFNPVMDELTKRKSELGDKKYHSETSLQHYGEEDDADKLQRKSVVPYGEVSSSNEENVREGDADAEAAAAVAVRRRTMSQPGPLAGAPMTAAAARAARRRQPRSVAYAEPLHIEGKPDGDEQPMVLQLVVPPSALRQGNESSTDPSTIDARGTVLRPASFNSDLLSPKSLGSYSFTNRSYANSNGDLRSLAGISTTSKNRRRSVMTIDATSIRSMETVAPPPSSKAEKNRLFGSYLTVSLSVAYAVFLVTAGIIIFVGDVFVNYSISEYYCLYLIVVGFIYLLYIYIDIRIYIEKAKKQQRSKEEHEEAYEEILRKQEMEFGDNPLDFRPNDTYKSPPLPPLPVKPLSHLYCFSSSHHASNFYLKLGAAGFAMGHLVHCVLLISVQVGFLVGDYDDCGSIPKLVLDVIYPLYSFMQLFFIFKFSNVIILRCPSLARFALMHLIGSSLCFWLWAIVRETIDALTIYAQNYYQSGYGDDDDDNYEEIAGESEINSQANRFINISSLVDEACLGSPAMNTIFENFSPYLYPFTVEYSILIVAIFYIIWQNIGDCPTSEEDIESHGDMNSSDSTENTCRNPALNEDNGFASNLVIHADCHASNRGLFGGMVVVVLVIVIIILGFIAHSSELRYLVIVADYVSDMSQLILHGVMFIAVAVAYKQIRALDVNQHEISMLDDIQLFICIPAYFMDSIFTMVATIAILNVLRFMEAVVVVLQVLIQTSFLIDAMRRCSNTRRLRRNKPGRELVMFLLITNLAIWIFQTFSIKNTDSTDERYEFYGKALWTVLGHISLPLRMFYRFHSSVCLADVWKGAYHPGSGH